MNAERLLKLAEHLEAGALGHDYFDFARLSVGPRKLNSCGIAGCALGECPFVFATEWEFIQRDDSRYGYEPVLIGDRYNTLGSAARFFDLGDYEYDDLFIPYAEPAPWNDFALGDNATREQVAQGIRNFIAWKWAQGQPVEEREAVMEMAGVAR